MASSSDAIQPVPEGTSPQARAVMNLKVLSPSTEVNGELHFPDLPTITTVGELKGLIQQKIASSPPLARQRIIYRGRVVANEADTMVDIFGRTALQESPDHTLHLVLRELPSSSNTSRPGTAQPPANPFRGATATPPIRLPPPPVFRVQPTPNLVQPTNPFRAQVAGLAPGAQPQQAQGQPGQQGLPHVHGQMQGGLPPLQQFMPQMPGLNMPVIPQQIQDIINQQMQLAAQQAAQQATQQQHFMRHQAAHQQAHQQAQQQAQQQHMHHHHHPPAHIHSHPHAHPSPFPNAAQQAGSQHRSATPGEPNGSNPQVSGSAPAAEQQPQSQVTGHSEQNPPIPAPAPAPQVTHQIQGPQGSFTLTFEQEFVHGPRPGAGLGIPIVQPVLHPGANVGPPPWGLPNVGGVPLPPQYMLPQMAMAQPRAEIAQHLDELLRESEARYENLAGAMEYLTRVNNWIFTIDRQNPTDFSQFGFLIDEAARIRTDAERLRAILQQMAPAVHPQPGSMMGSVVQVGPLVQARFDHLVRNLIRLINQANAYIRELTESNPSRTPVPTSVTANPQLPLPDNLRAASSMRPDIIRNSEPAESEQLYLLRSPVGGYALLMGNSGAHGANLSHPSGAAAHRPHYRHSAHNPPVPRPAQNRLQQMDVAERQRMWQNLPPEVRRQLELRQAARRAGQPLPPLLPNQPGAAAAGNQVQAQQQQQDQNQNGVLRGLIRLMVPAAGNLWLILRLLSMVYLFAGGTGWRRPLILGVLGGMVYLVQLGVFGNQWLRIRRHFENLIPLAADPRNPQPPQGQQQPAQPGQQPQQQPADGAQPAQHAQHPNPADTANRLVQQHQQRQQTRIQEQLRNTERAIALFVASLWPGVGERHIAAREEMDRRAREAENPAPAPVEGQPATEGQVPAEGQARNEGNGQVLGQAGDEDRGAAELFDRVQSPAEGSSTGVQQNQGDGQSVQRRQVGEASASA